MIRNINLALIFVGVFTFGLNAQISDTFKSRIETLCGRAFEGQVTSGGVEGDGFTGERLVMQVLSCKSNEIKIPFYAGSNKSRTWVLNFSQENISLKHEHKNSDGTDEDVTLYGGIASNTGWANQQMFPADEFTCKMIDYACHNVWWITVDDTTFSYNLHRVGTNRFFTVVFDLTKPVVYDGRPWGWAGN